MNGDDRHWQREDGWVLVALARGSGRMRRFFFCADAINKTVPSYEETNGALRRLSSAGLVRRSGDEFAVTREGRRLLRKSRARSSVYDHIARTKAALSATPAPAKLPRWQVTRDLYDAELEQYHKDFKRDLESLDHGVWRLRDVLDGGVWWVRRKLRGRQGA